MLNSTNIWIDAFNEGQKTVADILADKKFINQCTLFSKVLVDTINRGGNIFSCGNGGSHCDAMHFAEELTGRYKKNRKPIGAIALGDPSHITCVSNDMGFEYIFERQIEGLGRSPDLLLAISTSGNSKNICLAVEAAKKKGIKTVALTGKTGGQLKSLVDLCLIVPSQSTERIQEVHIKIIHIAIESLERVLFPQNYMVDS